MTLETPTANPEMAEIFNQISQLLPEKKDGSYTADGITCFIWTIIDVRERTPGRAMQLKYNGLYDFFQVSIRGGTFTLSRGFIGGQFDINTSKDPEAALSALNALLAALKTVQPNPEIAIVTASMEDRVNKMLEEEGLPPYEDTSGAVAQFYKRP